MTNMLINEIKGIDELKKLNISQLEEQAKLIREFIIENVSHTGGHLSANLGVVELTIALHYVFNSPKDKFIFDVGHQTYAHKIITGRKDQFSTLRCFNGLSGFPKYSESEHDIWETGHSSTSIGAAIGFLEAKKINNDIGQIIAIIGDGAIQNGLALSSLNYLATRKNEKVIIIVNDNEMSISKNVGGLADFFNKLRIKKSYGFFRKITPKFIRNTFKNFVYKNDNLFTHLGFKYFGPIDGHNIKDLIKYLNYAKDYPNSIILHIKTVKGKGYLPSEMDYIGKWHGVGPFDILTGEQNLKIKEGYLPWSQLVGKTLLEKVNENSRIRILSPAMIYGSGLDEIAEKRSDIIIDVGINEEMACLMAATMSRNGLLPIVSIYSSFLQRAYDILNHDINRSNNHVVFLVDRSGIISGDGSTHQGIYDLSFTTHLSNFMITMPRNQEQLSFLLDLAIKASNPFIIRYPKGNIKLLPTDNRILVPYKWEEVLPISDINILSYGPDINEFLEEIEKAKKPIGLINCLFIKPLDYDMINKLNGKSIIVYEEVVENGSLGSLISDYILTNNLSIKYIHYSIKNIFNEGKIDELKDVLGLNISKIIQDI